MGVSCQGSAVATPREGACGSEAEAIIVAGTPEPSPGILGALGPGDVLALRAVVLLLTQSGAALAAGDSVAVKRNTEHALALVSRLLYSEVVSGPAVPLEGTSEHVDGGCAS